MNRIILALDLLVGGAFATIISFAWENNKDMTYPLVANFVLLLIYINTKWQVRKWGQPQNEKIMGEQFKSQMKVAHIILEVLLVGVPIICISLVSLQVLLPDYAAQLISESGNKLGPGVPLSISGHMKAISDSCIVVLKTSSTTGYGWREFLVRFLAILFSPFSAFSLSLALITGIGMAGLWFAEIVGGTVYKYVKVK